MQLDTTDIPTVWRDWNVCCALPPLRTDSYQVLQVSPDSPMISETRSATVRTGQAQSALALNELVRIAATQSDWVPNAPVQIVVVQIVVTLND